MNQKLRLYLISKASRIVRALRMRKLIWGGYIHVSNGCIIEHGVGLDKINPQGIHIGSGTLVAGGTIILSHEHIFVKPDGSYYVTDTFIGNNCFIGVRSIICPGVKIGDECVIGAGSVVTKDIPSNCMAVGVPAKVIRTGIKMNEHARLEGDLKFKE